MNTIALNDLWTYIKGLSLSQSNKKWLSEKLIEDIEAESIEYKVEALNDALSEGLNSGFVSDFNPAEYLQEIKSKHNNE